MAAKSQEKIIFGVALLLLLASAGWLALQQKQLTALSEAPPASVTPSHYKPVGFDALTVATSVWPTPPSQSSGPDWVYDVFTPPEIYYNTDTKQFTVTPPVAAHPVVVVEIPFGIKLQQVKEDVFRLQLVGYVGNGDTALGTFQNMVTGETLLARAGKKIDSLGLTIQSFEVVRRFVPTLNSMPIYEAVATAVVIDDKTGEKLTITNKKRSIKGPTLAILSTTDGSQTFEQKAGSSFKVGSATYSIDSVTVQPPSVTVTKKSSDSKSPVTQTLTPEAGTPAASVVPSPAASAPPMPADSVFPNSIAPAGN